MAYYTLIKAYGYSTYTNLIASVIYLLILLTYILIDELVEKVLVIRYFIGLL